MFLMHMCCLDYQFFLEKNCYVIVGYVMMILEFELVIGC